jgi:hypothetical protein
MVDAYFQYVYRLVTVAAEMMVIDFKIMQPLVQKPTRIRVEIAA